MTPEREPQPEGLTLERVTQMAKETVMAEGGHEPMLMVDGSKGSVVVLIAEMAATHEGRLRQMFVAGGELGQMAEVGELSQVFFISEGWMSTAKEGKPPRKPPSEDPNRKEVLIVTHSQVADNQTQMKVFEMIRDSQGELTDLRDFEPGATNETSVKSPLLDAFTAGFRIGTTGKLN